MARPTDHDWIGYAAAGLSIAGLTALLKLAGVHVNATTVALALLLNVLFIATRWGSLPALLASVLAMLCFNFFFLPPFGTFSISAPDNWIALTAFLITAVSAGQLSARAKRRALEAEASRREVERLYAELTDAFAAASHAEALKQSEKLKSALLDAVTHDLRTPLASIKTSITMLLDDFQRMPAPTDAPRLDPTSRAELMEIINQESDRLNRFISGLIELARIEAGELQLRRNWGVVDEIVSAARARAAPLLLEHTVRLEIERELPLVRVDERAVAEVVYNLLENAAKYSPRGTLITVSARSGPNDLVEMAIDDSGPGIPEELRERVFDKFFRATDRADPDPPGTSGTGMGLAIAKGIVEAHGGTIRIEDGSSGGTRVIFTLPIGDDES